MVLQRELSEENVRAAEADLPATPSTASEPEIEKIEDFRPPRPKRILLPNQPVNIQLVQGEGQPEVKPPPKKPKSPWETATGKAVDSFERQAANLADTIQWTLERVGPNSWGGRRVPCGTFPEEYSGPATASVIGEIGGGGTYFVAYTDPATNDSKRLGPIKIAGTPRFDIGIQEESEGYVYPDGFTADSPMRGREREKDEWIRTFDPMLGEVMRRSSDLERDHRFGGRVDPATEALGKRLDAQAESIKALAEGMTKSINALAQMVTATPKEDPAAKWLEIERQRILAEKETKAAELKHAREKADRELELARQRIEADKEIAEKKLEAEREKADREKAEITARLEAEKEKIEAARLLAEDRAEKANQLAQDKLEHAHDTMLKLLGDRADPMQQMGSVFGLFREVQDLLGSDKEEVGEKAKSNKEKALEALLSGAQRMYSTAEPALKQWLVAQAEQARRAGVAIPAEPSRQIQSRPAPQTRQEPVVSQPQNQSQQPTVQSQADPTDVMTKIMNEISSSIDRNVAPSAVWQNIVDLAPMAAVQLKAYKDPEALANDVMMIASAPGYEKNAKKLSDLAGKITGAGRRWTETFLKVVEKAEIPST